MTTHFKRINQTESGYGIERGGSGIERGGSGIERGGSGLHNSHRIRGRRGRLMLLGALLVAFGGTGVATASEVGSHASVSAWEAVGDLPGVVNLQQFSNGSFKLVLTARTSGGQPLMLVGHGKAGAAGTTLELSELVANHELGIKQAGLTPASWGDGVLHINSCASLSLDLFVHADDKTQQSGSGKTQQSGSGKTQQSGSGKTQQSGSGKTQQSGSGSAHDDVTETLIAEPPSGTVGDKGTGSAIAAYFGSVDLYPTFGDACGQSLAGVEKTQQSGSGS